MKTLLAAVLLLGAGAASAQAPQGTEPTDREDALLGRRHVPELVETYKGLEPGPIPDGESQGRAAGLPGTVIGRIQESLFRVFWQGKVFDAKDGRLVNKILGGRAVKAKVFYGPSWIDGKPSIIIDYKDTSWLAGGIRDEIRMVEPGLYFGFAFQRGSDGRPARADIVFALDFDKSKWKTAPPPDRPEGL